MWERNGNLIRKTTNRVRTGEERVDKAPSNSPELWRLSTARDKREANADYEATLMSVEPSVVARSGVPLLPRAASDGCTHVTVPT